MSDAHSLTVFHDPPKFSWTAQEDETESKLRADYLLERAQAELKAADNADSEASRCIHRELARAYAARAERIASD